MDKENKRMSRSIKSLIQKAEHGSVASQFQLYEYYKQGKYVDQDDVIAEEYLALLANTVKEQKLFLNNLKLKDFRRFRELNLELDRNITVIIGDNGAGKTSIAEAIAKVFSWVNNNLEKNDVNGKPVTLSDINVNSTDYSEIECEFILSKGNKFSGSLVKTTSGYSGSHSGTDVTSIKPLGAIYRHVALDDRIKLPLLAFYSVARSDFSLPMSISEKASDVVTSNRYLALKNALEGNGRLDDFSVLYIELVNLAEGKNSQKILVLKKQINTLQNALDDVYQGDIPTAGDPLAEKLKERKVELERLEREVNPMPKRHLEAVNHAIESMVSDVKKPQVDRSSGKPQILVENFGNLINIAQLSKGQQTLVALTGDLAMRLVKLNPEADDPLSGHGIVVIDEIELHLHPRWQQEILIGLQETFPNLQFIVTTHSPQVLSTVDHKCIRQITLDDLGEPMIVTPHFQTKGVASAEILARIMGTNSVPEKLKEATWLTEFSRYVKNGDTASRDKVFEDIIQHFGAQHPVVMDCESRIRIAEMNERLNKSKC